MNKALICSVLAALLTTGCVSTLPKAPWYKPTVETTQTVPAENEIPAESYVPRGATPPPPVTPAEVTTENPIDALQALERELEYESQP